MDFKSRCNPPKRNAIRILQSCNHNPTDAWIRSTVKVYADDTKVYRPITNPQDAEQLQEDLDRLVSWSNIWQLPFNIEKCKVMHIGNTNPKFEYSMASQKLEVTSQEKDLGVIVDKSLSFHAHTGTVVARAYRTLGIIRRTFINLDRNHTASGVQGYGATNLRIREHCMGTYIYW